MPATKARTGISDEEVSALLEKNSADAVRPYDFTAQRINRMQLPHVLPSLSSTSTLENRVTMSFVKGITIKLAEDLHESGTTGCASLQAVMLEGGITPSP
jgi:hypothetical protein